MLTAVIRHTHPQKAFAIASVETRLIGLFLSDAKTRENVP